jgi:hypothetical protein
MSIVSYCQGQFGRGEGCYNIAISRLESFVHGIAVKPASPSFRDK